MDYSFRWWWTWWEKCNCNYEKIRKIEKNPEDNIIFALNRAISMDEDYYNEQFINFLDINI